MLNQKTRALIAEFEGYHLSCYHLGDGVCTIGYGHTRPLSQCAGAGTWKISPQQAEEFLNQDTQIAQSAVLGYFTRNLNDNQIGALTSFAYNLGSSVFVKYQFEANGTDKQITDHMMLFLNKGTKFEEGITRRRKAEVALFLDPDVQGTNISNLIGESDNMKMIQLTTDGDYYGHKWIKGAIFVVSTESIRYIERPQTLGILRQLCGQEIPATGEEMLLFIQDMDLPVTKGADHSKD